MLTRDIVVIGASLGGTEAVPRLLSKLPADFPAAVFVVQHLQPDYATHLVELIQSRTARPAAFASDNTAIQPRHIWVAPPDHHLELTGDHMRLARGPRQNCSRPAIDPLFRSAAQAHGARVIGVVLTGMLDDGTIGLNAVKVHGGVALVQDPAEAFAPQMPASALRNVAVDFCLPLEEMSAKLTELAGSPVPATAAVPGETPLPESVTEMGMTPDEMTRRFGPPVPYVCPDCHGPLWTTDPDQFALRCHVGHQYSLESLVHGNEENLERALWSAVRAMEQQASLLERLTKRNPGGNWAERAERCRADAELIRELLQRPRVPSSKMRRPRPKKS
jgi:two-component system chemotaxis response regulator CheB